MTKVAKVLDEYSVALNRGDEDGVCVGQIYTICAQDVIDPETGENLGAYPKVRVKVVEAYPRFCVAETYRLTCWLEPAVVTVNVGDPAYLRP